MIRDVWDFIPSEPLPRLVRRPTLALPELPFGSAVAAESLQTRRLWPYGVDAPGERLLFTEHDNDTELYSAPFINLVQMQTATRLLSVPIERLEGILPAAPTTKLAVVFCMPRSGSTLLMNMLRSPHLISLSELDVFSQIAALWALKDSRFETMADVAFHYTMESLQCLAAKAGALAVKMRGEVNAEIPRMLAKLPGATFIFVLREPFAWARSMHRAFAMPPQELQKRLSVHLRQVADLRRACPSTIVLHYDDLVQRSGETASLVAGRCGVELDAAALNHVERTVLAIDSQEGTALARDRLHTAAEESAAVDTAIQQHLEQNVGGIQRLLRYSASTVTGRMLEPVPPSAEARFGGASSLGAACQRA